MTKAHLASQREFFYKTENSARPGDGKFQFDVNEQGDRELMGYAYVNPPGNNIVTTLYSRDRIFLLGSSYCYKFKIRQTHEMPKVAKNKFRSRNFNMYIPGLPHTLI